jgi:hypothetical protein
MPVVYQAGSGGERLLKTTVVPAQAGEPSAVSFDRAPGVVIFGNNQQCGYRHGARRDGIEGLLLPALPSAV